MVGYYSQGEDSSGDKFNYPISREGPRNLSSFKHTSNLLTIILLHDLENDK